MALSDVQPIYIELEGWQEPTAGISRFEDLNDTAVFFIKKIEELCGAPVVMISTGPRREDTIIREYPLKK
jgi:adenylosuccinate synthase